MVQRMHKDENLSVTFRIALLVSFIFRKLSVNDAYEVQNQIFISHFFMYLHANFWSDLVQNSYVCLHLIITHRNLVKIISLITRCVHCQFRKYENYKTLSNTKNWQYKINDGKYEIKSCTRIYTCYCQATAKYIDNLWKKSKLIVF